MTVSTIPSTISATEEEQVTDSAGLRAGEPTIDSVLAGLNPKGVALTDEDKRRVLQEALAAGKLFPREIARLTEAGWLEQPALAAS